MGQPLGRAQRQQHPLALCEMARDVVQQQVQALRPQGLLLQQRPDDIEGERLGRRVLAGEPVIGGLDIAAQRADADRELAVGDEVADALDPVG
jgi:hypothetical protein